MEKLPPGKPRDQDIWGVFKNNWFNQFLGGFGSLFAAITGTVNDSYVRDLPIITDHTAQLSAQATAIEQMTARGKAVVFSQSGWYYPPKDLVTLRIVGIGAGAGGAAGQWNLVGTGRNGGGGGGGGGYQEIEITAAFLPKTGDDFDPIRVDMFLAGNGGVGSETPGGGGGNIIFGANLSIPYATFQGGVGGVTASSVRGGGGIGGLGMVPGGKGGDGARLDGDSNNLPATNGTSSFASERFMGGGGAGGGGGRSNSTSGGFGGNGVGTAGGIGNQAGVSPHPAMSIGAGGGGGSSGESSNGGAGGFPGGGGGGGFGGTMGTASAGGPGGQPKLYCYEEMN